MQRTLTILPLLSLLLTTAACPDPGSDEGGQEASDTETGDGDGDGGDGDGDGDGDDVPDEDLCASACFQRLDCGLVTADEIDACIDSCDAEIEAWKFGFGDDCAQAQEVFSYCLLTEECMDPDFYIEECSDFEPYQHCTETVIPELDQLCECVAANDPGPNAKQVCVLQMSDWVIEGYGDGLECMGEVTNAFACMASTCEDSACNSEEPPDMCLCSEAQDALLDACPSFGE